MNQRGAVQVNATMLTLAGVGILVVAILVYFSWIGSYLGARLFGPDIGSWYTPLVHHVQYLSGLGVVDCYDSGSSAYFCEEQLRPTFIKRRTLVYLYSGLPPKAYRELYSCAKSHVLGSPVITEGYEVTTNRAECQAKDLRAFRLGYLFEQPQGEASVALYKCKSAETNSTLLTVDSHDCKLTGFSEPVLLGYGTLAASWPMEQLFGACAATKAACDASSTLKSCTATHVCKTINHVGGDNPALENVAIEERVRRALDANNDKLIGVNEALTVLADASNSVGTPEPALKYDFDGDGILNRPEIALLIDVMRKYATSAGDETGGGDGPEGAAQRMFVTSANYPGDFTDSLSSLPKLKTGEKITWHEVGSSRASQICAVLAQNAGLTSDYKKKEWIAMLSFAQPEQPTLGLTSDARSLITNVVKNLKGEVIATNADEFVNAAGNVTDENSNSSPGGRIWTGSDRFGYLSSKLTCGSGWTNGASQAAGAYGRAGAGDWFNDGLNQTDFQSCNEGAHLYCIENPRFDRTDETHICRNVSSQIQTGDGGCVRLNEPLGSETTAHPEGAVWSLSARPGAEYGYYHYRWDDARSYCEDLTAGGRSDWHLPSVTELQTLTTDKNGGQTMNHHFNWGGTNPPDAYYWSSTTGTAGTDQVQVVVPDDGATSFKHKNQDPRSGPGPYTVCAAPLRYPPSPALSGTTSSDPAATPSVGPVSPAPSESPAASPPPSINFGAACYPPAGSSLITDISPLIGKNPADRDTTSFTTVRGGGTSVSLAASPQSHLALQVDNVPEDFREALSTKLVTLRRATPATSGLSPGTATLEGSVYLKGAGYQGTPPSGRTGQLPCGSRVNALTTWTVHPTNCAGISAGAGAGTWNTAATWNNAYVVLNLQQQIDQHLAAVALEVVYRTTSNQDRTVVLRATQAQQCTL